MVSFDFIPAVQYMMYFIYISFRPDVVVLDKIERSCYVIDIACPFDTRVLEKEQEKMEKYQELKREIGKVWSCK